MVVLPVDITTVAVEVIVVVVLVAGAVTVSVSATTKVEVMVAYNQRQRASHAQAVFHRKGIMDPKHFRRGRKPPSRNNSEASVYVATFWSDVALPKVGNTATPYLVWRALRSEMGASCTSLKGAMSMTENDEETYRGLRQCCGYCGVRSGCDGG